MLHFTLTVLYNYAFVQVFTLEISFYEYTAWSRRPLLDLNFSPAIDSDGSAEAVFR